MILSPSILSADFGNLQSEIEMLNKSNADWIHVDVMDGVFVPNISFGFPILKFVKKIAKKEIDVHLMINNPDSYIKQFSEAGASILTVHYESCTHLHRIIQNIKNNGMKAGLALNPHTPVSFLENIIADIDMVLIMSVNPGFAAQKFIPNTYNKIEELKKLIESKQSKTLIQVDGGVNLENASMLIEKGANSLVAGNAIFNTPNPIETIKKFKSILV